MWIYFPVSLVYSVCGQLNKETLIDWVGRLKKTSEILLYHQIFKNVFGRV